MTSDDRETWRAIQQDAWYAIYAAAREQVAVDIELLMRTPLEFGQGLVWALQENGATAGITSLHRVGFPIGAAAYTSCGERIPHPICWLPLSPAMMQTLPPCKFCAAEYERALRMIHDAA